MMLRSIVLHERASTSYFNPGSGGGGAALGENGRTGRRRSQGEGEVEGVGGGGALVGRPAYRDRPLRAEAAALEP